MPGHFQRPRESQFPEVSVLEVRPRRARSPMLTEAPRRPVASTYSHARPGPEPAGVQPFTTARMRAGWFPVFEERTPSSTFQPLLPYLRSLSLPSIFSKSLSRSQWHPRTPTPRSWKGVSTEAPSPARSPGAKSGRDTGANWQKSDPVVGFGWRAPTPAAPAWEAGFPQADKLLRK